MLYPTHDLIILSRDGCVHVGLDQLKFLSHFTISLKTIGDGVWKKGHRWCFEGSGTALILWQVSSSFLFLRLLSFTFFIWMHFFFWGVTFVI